MWLVIWKTILTSPATKYVLIAIGVILLIIAIVMHYTKGYKVTIDRLQYNETVGNINVKIWTNKYNQVIAENYARELTVSELLNSNDQEIMKLKNNIRKKDVKIKDLEYEISVNAGFDMDSIVPIFEDTIYITDEKTIIQRLDSLVDGDFRLRRREINNTSHYDISYTPTLYISISSYKYGKWRFANLFRKRDIRYKATVSTSDDRFKPKDIQVIKVN